MVRIAGSLILELLEEFVFLTIRKLLNANSVISCAVFLARPRYLTLVNPNWHLMTRNGCSTLARTLALSCSALSSKAPT